VQKCQRCGEGILASQDSHGRIRKYCSDKCRNRFTRNTKPSKNICGSCGHCGQTFYGISSRRYCSSECARLHRRSPGSRKSDELFTCEICARDFPRHYGGANRCCSRKCGFALLALDRNLGGKFYKEPVQGPQCGLCSDCKRPCAPSSGYCDLCRDYRNISSCVACNGYFIKQAPQQTSCCAKCRAAVIVATARRNRGIALNFGSCKECGTIIISYSPIRIYCSSRCRLRVERRIDHASESARHRRKVAKITRVDPREIYARDRWKCGLCNRKIDPSLKYPNKMSASIDHIWPLSCGGHHVPENLQPAHWICNVRKRAGAGGQLMLSLTA
jgi:hypothetical protein